jgi:threonine aldolase
VKQHKLNSHLDGARVFNAAVKLNVPVQAIAQYFDSISVCLSKGLGAPVGSVLCGAGDVISKARRWRKVLGGGMRQAGVLAAAGIIALTDHVERLAEDHANAKRLAEGLSRIAGISIDPSRIQTNIVYFSIDRPDLAAPDLAQRLNTTGVRVLPTGPQQLRAVTQYHIGPPDIDAALTIFEKTMASI